MRSIRVAAARHPHVVDAAFAVLLAGALVPDAAANGTAGLGWAAYALLHLPLAWRRRAPRGVFWVAVVLVLLSLPMGLRSISALVVPLVAVYTMARYRPRHDLWPAAVATPIAALWVGSGGWWDGVALVATVAASALLGMNIQTRRAYLAELEDRARRLERERDQRAQLAVAGERARIAREMHDIVAHNLAVMVALTDGAAATATADSRRAVDMMEKASTTGREALGEVRRLVGLLREDERDGLPAEGAQPSRTGGTPAPQPGLDDIGELVGQVRAAGLTVALTRDGTPGDWGPGAGLTVYRIVQEALTNTMKHAGPQASAEVRLRYLPTFRV